MRTDQIFLVLCMSSDFVLFSGHIGYNVMRVWILLKSSRERCAFFFSFCSLFLKSINSVKFRLQVQYHLLWVTVPMSVQFAKCFLCFFVVVVFSAYTTQV